MSEAVCARYKIIIQGEKNKFKKVFFQEDQNK